MNKNHSLPNPATTSGILFRSQRICPEATKASDRTRRCNLWRVRRRNTKTKGAFGMFTLQSQKGALIETTVCKTCGVSRHEIWSWMIHCNFKVVRFVWVLMAQNIVPTVRGRKNNMISICWMKSLDLIGIGLSKHLLGNRIPLMVFHFQFWSWHSHVQRSAFQWWTWMSLCGDCGSFNAQRTVSLGGFGVWHTSTINMNKYRLSLYSWTTLNIYSFNHVQPHLRHICWGCAINHGCPQSLVDVPNLMLKLVFMSGFLELPPWISWSPINLLCRTSSYAFCWSIGATPFPRPCGERVLEIVGANLLACYHKLPEEGSIIGFHHHTICNRHMIAMCTCIPAQAYIFCLGENALCKLALGNT